MGPVACSMATTALSKPVVYVCSVLGLFQVAGLVLLYINSCLCFCSCSGCRKGPVACSMASTACFKQTCSVCIICSYVVSSRWSSPLVHQFLLMLTAAAHAAEHPRSMSSTAVHCFKHTCSVCMLCSWVDVSRWPSPLIQFLLMLLQLQLL
jgi:hypothetical protein